MFIVAAFQAYDPGLIPGQLNFFLVHNSGTLQDSKTKTPSVNAIADKLIAFKYSTGHLKQKCSGMPRTGLESGLPYFCHNICT